MITLAKFPFLDQIPFLSTLGSKFAIITDETVAAHWGNALQKNLAEHFESHLFSFPSGEANKTRSTKEKIEDRLFEKGFGSDSCIIALGGGVVTDLAGFIAASFCRGIPFVSIPTSLLGMVDASLGGKTGVNVPYGKNMLGAHYCPKKILIDPGFLTSLPKKERISGTVEMIKHGAILDRDYFNDLESANGDQDMQKAILESCRIKMDVVAQSKEKGIRNLLNFGHTVAHSLELLSGYSLSHGEAVAIGMLVESRMAQEMGLLASNDWMRLRNILIRYEVPLKLTPMPVDTLINAMLLDKKSIRGSPRFVMIDQIGSCLPFQGEYCTSVEMTLLKTTLEWMNDAFSRH